jgi:pyruvate/2-oxoglutarate dehydrogenase complex dihydrolipoamide dehydrogenase (E3) component
MHWDVVVIGAGQAGAPLSARLAEAGRRVLLIERLHVGGTCVNYGCTPTKTMVASARAAHVARNASRLGVHTERVQVDWQAVIARKERLVLQWRDSVQKRIERAGDRLTLVHGRARFADVDEILVNGERHTADVVIINVGTRPAVPKLDGLDQVTWLDNATIMELSELPNHLLVMGGGFIGCEFAQMFRRFGADVTLIDRMPHLLAREDAEISESIESVFRAEGIRLELSVDLTRVEAREQSVSLYLRDGRTLEGTHLLIATGRTPNTDDLGCPAAGISLDERGYIKVDDEYRTSAAGIYAVGDVTGGPQFTHDSWDDHRILYDILLGRPAHSRTGRITPRVTFTDPQVAGVGLTEAEARSQGVRAETVTLPFGKIARAIEIDEDAGAIKVLIDPEKETVLGAAIVGAEAGELIHIFAVLIAAGAPASVLVDMQIAHPTFAEGLQSALMKLPRYRL